MRERERERDGERERETDRQTEKGGGEGVPAVILARRTCGHDIIVSP